MNNSTQFEPTRAAGFARLKLFVPSAGRIYQAKRNSDLGPDHRENVSVLSPYIRHRLVTEVAVLSAVLAKHSPSDAEKFIQEVFWRTYFKGFLETRPVVWSNYLTARNNHISNLGQYPDYERAVAANTGIDCLDAWVTELRNTGYLHNHARMWFASIWIFTLHLPWELGADFMYRHLLDGDPASNTLSWRWVGGLHTKGKTYLARADNIKTYTDGRFKPASLAKTAPALEEPQLPHACPLRAAESKFPIGRLGLLLTEEDMHPESLDHRNAKIIAIAGMTLVGARSPLFVSNHVHDFANGAMADALRSASIAFGAPSEMLAPLSAQSIENWARKHNIDTVVSPYAPVGPTAVALTEITNHLQSKGIKLVEVRREFDTLAWPHATRGFFGMKDKIPDLLRNMRIGPDTVDKQLSLFSTWERA
jgi:deoxyribodipyrimidine photo-lyase